jgi:RNase P subunit RPR2
MFAARQVPLHRGAVFERAFVICEKCQSPIVVNRPDRVSVEFSVPCKRCGHRGIYFKRMLVTEDVAERRKFARD